MTERVATIRTSGRISAELVDKFLPSNYRVSEVDEDCLWIRGEDKAGWTLDGYVIPRLASGLIFAQEVTDDVVN